VPTRHNSSFWPRRSTLEAGSMTAARRAALK